MSRPRGPPHCRYLKNSEGKLPNVTSTPLFAKRDGLTKTKERGWYSDPDRDGFRTKRFGEARTRRWLSIKGCIADSSICRRLAVARSESEMHYVRLLGECRELLREHKVTLPRSEKKLLIDIRSGKYTQEQVFEFGDDLARKCQQLLENSDLPDRVNVHILSKQIADAYQFHWSHMTASTDD